MNNSLILEFNKNNALFALSGKTNTILFKGSVIFPLYSVAEEVVNLTYEKVDLGKVAIKSFKVLNAVELNDEELKSFGIHGKAELTSFLSTEKIVTLAEIVPILETEDIGCGENCVCKGNCV